MRISMFMCAVALEALIAARLAFFFGESVAASTARFRSLFFFVPLVEHVIFSRAHNDLPCFFLPLSTTVPIT
jgi:hypothetical protein